MGEIITKVIPLREGCTMICDAGDYLIKEKHTISDILRFVVDECCGGDKEEAAITLKFL